MSRDDSGDNGKSKAVRLQVARPSDNSMMKI